MAQEEPPNPASDPEPKSVSEVSFRLSLETFTEIAEAVGELRTYVTSLKEKQHIDHYQTLAPLVAKLAALVEGILEQVHGAGELIDAFNLIEERKEHLIRERAETPEHARAIEQLADEKEKAVLDALDTKLKTLATKKQE